MIWKHDLILLSAKLFLELSSLTISSVYSFTTMLGNSVSWGMLLHLSMEEHIRKKNY